MSPEPSPPQPTFPTFTAPLVRILLSLIFIGGYLVLFIWGLWLGAFDNGKGTWPTDNENFQSALAAVGGIAATLFTVALNLPRQEAKEEDETQDGAAPKVLRLPGMSASVLLRRTGLRGVGQASARVLGLVRTPDWEGLDRKILVFLGTLLVVLYPFLTLIGFAETIFRAERDVPAFIVKFAGPGLGILLTAFTISMSRLTRPK